MTEDAFAAGPATGRRVRLTTMPPLESVTVDDIVITIEGVIVDEETARRAHEAANLAGFQLIEEEA